MSDLVGNPEDRFSRVEAQLLYKLVFKGLLLKELILVPLFIRLMTPNGVIWSLDERAVILR